MHGSSEIVLFAASTMQQAAIEAARFLSESLGPRALFLPSSLDREDHLVRALRRQLRTLSVASSVVVPQHPVLAAAVRTGWRAVEISPLDKAAREVLLPARLLAGDRIVYATHVDTVARRGPFQLDLLSRYVHPRGRIRQLVDPDRAGLAAEVNLAIRPEWSAIGWSGSLGIVAATRDMIAGELLALCMAERLFDRTTEFSSPWEDRVVQRATELELGARTPDDIRIRVAGDAANASGELAVIVDEIRQRIGIGTFDAC